MSEPPVPRSAYRAFISYSHRDKAWADWLHKALETWRAPARLVGVRTAHGTIPRRLSPVFRDRDELASATDLGHEIEEALRQSENLIVICSPAAAASRWVNAEVLAYQRMGRGRRIFCLIVDGDPAATGNSGTGECFCPALRTPASDDPDSLHGEPIAADVRPGGDGKPDAKLKLIAGMLGIGFDTLKQREQHRRAQRLAVITALAVVVTAVTSVLTVFALIARHDAITARHKAVVAQQAAERRQKQAEGLVGFMLGDLYARLEQMQRLDIVQSVNDKAMAYFAALPPTDVNDASMAQRARALEQIGVVRMGLGNLAGALESFRASSRISANLAAADASNAARQVAYARTLAFIGTVHWQQNKLAEAQQDFEAVQPALRKLAAQPRPDPAVLFHLAMLDHNLGRVMEARGHGELALQHYREGLELSQRLSASAPDDSDYAGNLGTAHNDLARLALQRGDLLTAIVEFRANDVIQAQLSRADRQDNIQRQNALEARAALGRALALAGETGQAADQLADAVDTAAQLVKFEPANTDFRLDLALYSAQLARLKRLGGDAAAARSLTANAAEIFAALMRKDPGNVEWKKHAAAAMLEQAALSLAGAHREAAQAQARAALQRLEPIHAERPGDHDTLLLAATARLQLAAATTARSEARELAQQTLQMIRTDSVGAGDARLRALEVEALLMLDDRQAAQPLIGQLWQSGYRDPGFLQVLERAHVAYRPNPEFGARLLAATAAGAATPAPAAAPSQ